MIILSKYTLSLCNPENTKYIPLPASTSDSCLFPSYCFLLPLVALPLDKVSSDTQPQKHSHFLTTPNPEPTPDSLARLPNCPGWALSHAAVNDKPNLLNCVYVPGGLRLEVIDRYYCKSSSCAVMFTVAVFIKQNAAKQTKGPAVGNQ